MNYNRIQFLTTNNNFSSNFIPSSMINKNNNSNLNLQNNMQNSYHPDYFTEESENLKANQINHMKIQSNNLMELNSIESNGHKSFTDPCCEEIYFNKKSSSYIFTSSENEPDNRIFPVIGQKNINFCQNEDSFDNSNINEE